MFQRHPGPGGWYVKMNPATEAVRLRAGSGRGPVKLPYNERKGVRLSGAALITVCVCGLGVGSDGAQDPYQMTGYDVSVIRSFV